MKKVLLAALGASLLVPAASARIVGKFDDKKDILIAGFDMKPDHDDVHAAAALGSFLKHPSFSGVGNDNRLVVYGTIGMQGGLQIKPASLFNIAFGNNTYRWTDALNDRGASLYRVRRRAGDVLRNGGKVWVQEAGQSSFTFTWLRQLRDNTDIPHNTIKNNVRVVQHSVWNEDQTPSGHLTQVKKWATYIAIDDGNKDWGKGPNRGPNTPNYTVSWKQPIKDAQKPSKAPKNYKIWREAVKIINDQPAPSGSFNNPLIRNGGVDFSDCVENFYIFEFGNRGRTFSAFWNNYVFQ